MLCSASSVAMCAPSPSQRPSSFLDLSEAVCFPLHLSLHLRLDLLVSVVQLCGSSPQPIFSGSERSQLPSPALHQPLPSLSPGEVPRRDPLWGGEGQPTALSRCPGSCPFLQRQTQCRKLSCWGAQTHIWGLLGSHPCSLFDLKEQISSWRC